ncbi:MAG: DUF1289 domain-containing protein [Rhodospirillaceae bacterium]|nr:DUF1289 domain-containing protein [Rhodospirillaceae bacterium]
MDNVTDNVTPVTDLIASPCIGVCTVDRARNICIGCLRTLPEIGAWRAMTLEQKRAVVAACEERAKTWERLGKDWKPLETAGEAGEITRP